MDTYYESGDEAKATVKRFFDEINELIDQGAKISFGSNKYPHKGEKHFYVNVHYGKRPTGDQQND